MTVLFWVLFSLKLTQFFYSITNLTSDKYPRKKEHGVGYDCGQAIIAIGVLTWICILKWVMGGF